MPVNLMIDNGVGVSLTATYKVQKIDTAKGSLKNKFAELTLGFGSDLIVAIE
ncbi:MAG: hypothetical protein ACLFUT_12520 [Desulfobacteraceae bacterium]